MFRKALIVRHPRKAAALYPRRPRRSRLCNGPAVPPTSFPDLQETGAMFIRPEGSARPGSRIQPQGLAAK